jgi:hypothetical protein
MSAKDKNDKTNISYNKVGKGEYELHVLTDIFRFWYNRLQGYL